jgi:hypothetical protein
MVIKNIRSDNIFPNNSLSVVWISDTQIICKIKIPAEITDKRFDFLKLSKDTPAKIIVRTVKIS